MIRHDVLPLLGLERIGREYNFVLYHVSMSISN